MITRRRFMVLGGAGGLWVGAWASGCKGKQKKAPSKNTQPPAAAGETVPNFPPPPETAGEEAELSAWIHVAQNDVVTFFVPEAELGQGTHTAVAMILAAELGADFTKVRATHAPLNEAAFGEQSTGGSTSIRMGFDRFRTVAAEARRLLVQAGAEAMGVDAAECDTADSQVVSKKGEKSIAFGAVAAKAATLQPRKEEPELRATLPLVGTPQNRLDAYDKVTGRAVFGMDVRLPDMLTAQVAHGPTVGAKATRVDDARTRAVPGVRDVVQLDSGVAVVADHYWAAHKGKRALSVTWEEPHRDLDDAAIRRALEAAIDKGAKVRSDGNVDKVLGKAPFEVKAEYYAPYLAHAPMEPLVATAQVSKDRCEIWTSTQAPSEAAQVAAKITGLEVDKIAVHNHMSGGGFGRRNHLDYIAEAVQAATKTGKTIKVVWDREDDIRGQWYRPVSLHRLLATADPGTGKLTAWEHHIASPSILKEFRPLKGEVDRTAVAGVADLPYAVENIAATWADVDLPIHNGFWRSVSSSQNAFVTEAFFDEVALAAGKDPVEMRLANLTSDRHKAVVKLAAEQAGWSKPLGAKSGRGIAVHGCFGSIVAQVAEVTLSADGPQVERVVCVVDCGRVVNPRTIEAQMQSGIVFGLSAALYGDIRLEGGRVVQGNFDDYRVLRLREMPRVEVHIVQSDAPHGGIGEPGVPPIAPAVANAILSVTKKPVRRLPIVVTG